MKGAYATIAAATLTAGATGFVVPSLPAPRAHAGALSMTSAEQPMSRGEFFQKSVLGAAALLATLTAPAGAANYFGDKDDYPGVVKPQDAVVDKELLGSGSVKNSISLIKEYRDASAALADSLARNDQADLRAKAKSTFEFSKLRAVLNEANAVFDEDTQRGTDRLIRNIMQDAIELDDASKLSPGVPRSARKVEILKRKLGKLQKSFDDLLAFF